MASLKLFQLPPLTICLYLFLAVASSSIWFAGFTIQILHHGAESLHPPNRLRGILLEAALVVAYLLHFAIAVCVPICSRPWLWNLESKKSADFLEIFMIAMGYDDYEEEHWTIGGSRSVAAFAVALIPFLVPIERSAWGIAAIVALAAESFFLAETVKHTEMEEGFFYAAMVGATAATRRVFGYSSWESIVVILLCLTLIFFHSLLPFYDKEEFIFAADCTDSFSSAPDRGIWAQTEFSIKRMDS